jgi:hypothetical protein
MISLFLTRGDRPGFVLGGRGRGVGSVDWRLAHNHRHKPLNHLHFFTLRHKSNEQGLEQRDAHPNTRSTRQGGVVVWWRVLRTPRRSPTSCDGHTRPESPPTTETLDRSPVGRARKIREAAELRRRRSATTSGGQWRWVLVACGLWWPEVAHGCEGAACGVWRSEKGDSTANR